MATWQTFGLPSVGLKIKVSDLNFLLGLSLRMTHILRSNATKAYAE